MVDLINLTQEPLFGKSPLFPYTQKMNRHENAYFILLNCLIYVIQKQEKSHNVFIWLFFFKLILIRMRINTKKVLRSYCLYVRPKVIIK